MNYADIKYIDLANGVGLRTSLFVSGCPHHCLGCFSEQLWDYEYGNPFTKNEWEKIINSMDKYHSGISILGGDPLAMKNVIGLIPFIKEFKEKCPDKNIWVYTGYIFEDLVDRNVFIDEFLLSIDVLVDGPFILNQKDLTLKFRGSSNQRIIDVQKSLKNKEVVLYME